MSLGVNRTSGALFTRLTLCRVSFFFFSIPVKLPGIFPGPPLEVNGAPGNIQGNWVVVPTDFSHILQSYFTGNCMTASVPVKYSWRIWVNDMYMTPLWTQTKQNIRNRLYIVYNTLYSQWVSIVTVSAGCLLAPADLLFNSRITSYIYHIIQLHYTSWWSLEIKTFSASLVLCEGKPSVTGGFHKGQWHTVPWCCQWCATG